MQHETYEEHISCWSTHVKKNYHPSFSGNGFPQLVPGFGLLRVTGLSLLQFLSVVQELQEGQTRGAGEARGQTKTPDQRSGA